MQTLVLHTIEGFVIFRIITKLKSIGFVKLKQQSQIDYPINDKKKGYAQKIDQLLGERLKEIRKMKNLTQEDIADKLGISFQQIQKYENGKNRISFSRLYELSTFMKVPLDSFVRNIEANDGIMGMSDNTQDFLSPDVPDAISQKETDELLKIYYSIEDPVLRKDLMKFIKTMAENLKE